MDKKNNETHIEEVPEDPYSLVWVLASCSAFCCIRAEQPNTM